MGTTRPALFQDRWLLRTVASAAALMMLLWVGAMSPHLVHHLFDEDHMLASALWGGGLITLCTVMLPGVVKLPERRRLTAEVARRFSTLAGVALAGVLLTGLYNAWLQVGTISAMWETPYGRMLLVKLLLVCPVLAFGASNHYISVPLVERWARHPLPIPLPFALSPLMRRLLTNRLGLR
jgi:putative copper export protein